MREAPKDVPLLLLCAEDGEVGLVQLVDALNRSGRAPEVITGVESDSSLLASAADRVRGAALFVLCQSGDLDRSQVLRLEGLFSARKGPRHELLVVEVDASKPLDALPGIETAIASIAGQPGARVGVREEARVPKREVIVIPGEPRNRAVDQEQHTGEIEVLGFEEAERLAREEAEALAKSFHQEMLAAEAVLERRRGRREPRDAARLVEQLGIGIPQEIGGDALASTRRLELDIPVAIGLDDVPLAREPEPEPPDEPGGEEAPEEEASEEEAPEEEVGLLSSSLANVRVAEPLAPEPPAPAAIPTELTPTDTRPRRRDPEESDTSSPTQHLEETESRRGWLLGVVGAIALGGVALFAMQGSDEGTSRITTAAASTAPGATRGVAPSEPTAAPEVVRPPAAKVEAPPDPEPEAAPETARGLEPVGESAEPASASDIGEPSATSDLEDVKPTGSASVPPPPADSEALRIDDAILSGRIRGLDALLVARAGSDAVDWASAKSVCRRKRIAGLSGWSLPSRKELLRLRRARMLDEGTFWSRDRGPLGDDAYAVVSRSGATNVYLQMEPAAKVQCVRTR